MMRSNTTSKNTAVEEATLRAPHPTQVPKKKIVLADDNADMRAYVQRLLSTDYEVQTATDGQAALRLIAESPPDLVLTDVLMPNLDGFGLLKALRNDPQTADIPVIMISAQTGEEARLEGLERGADDYLSKPFQARELLARVSGALKLAQVRRDAAAALRESEERFAKAFNASPFILTISSLTTGKLLEVNDTFVRLSGYTREEAVGRSTTELGLWAKPQDREEGLTLVRQHGQARGVEFKFRTRNGEEVFGIASAEKLELGGAPCVLTVIADITERKRAEDALRESEARFRNMADHAPVMIWVAGKDGKCTYLNQSWYAFTGQTPELGLGNGWMEAIHPEDRATAEEVFYQAYERRTPFCIEYRLRRKDGEYGWVMDSAVPRFGPQSEFLGYIGSVIDITERKHAEDTLRENRERERARTEELEALMNAVPAAVWLAHDPACRLITGNRAASEMLRLPDHTNQSLSAPAEEQPHNFKVFKNGRELMPDELPVQVAARGIEVRDFEEEVVFENGDRSSLYGHAVPLRDSQGNVRGAVSAFVDITERKRAEEERERRYRDGLKLTEVNRALVGAFEIEQVTAIICRAARELTGADGATFVLRAGERVRYVDENSVSPLWKGQEFPLDCCISGWAIREGQQVVIEDIYQDMRIPHEAYDPTFVRSLVMTPVGPGNPVASIGVYWAHQYHASEYERELLQSLASAADLALAGVQAYDEARQARAQAEEANRLKDEFLATVSHELRTPLNAILGWAKMLLSGKLPAAEVLHALEIIERNARSQNRLIGDLLDVSRIISGKMQLELRPVNLAAVIEAAVNVVRPTAEAKGVNLYSILEAGTVSVTGDAERLQQVVWNLLSNAVKFTPREGSVLVQLEQVDTLVEITVSDTGAGINAEFLPYVFDRFRQADSSITRPHGGLGLGLAIVRHLTELHGGTIRVQSEGEDQGATFTISLPISAAACNASTLQMQSLHLQEAPVPDFGVRLDGIRLLVVDDELDARNLLLSMLKSSGAEVSAVESSAEGLRALAEASFDVIISDIEMPGEDGYSFLRKARSLQPEKMIPAIALTAHTRTADRVRALSAGYQSHVSKPVEPAELLAVIANLNGYYKH